MPGDNIVVAVRVRPFNDREKARKAGLIIEMPDGKATGIRDPSNMSEEPKWFTFDQSYWSHDGFKTESSGYLAPADPKYADQKKVFNDLGKGVLDNAWKGYNCSLFAYGQTGSGKSYSMVGYKENKGIVPIVCEELFKRIEKNKKKDDGTQYEVFFSMFEIYCEKVRDLLSSKPPPKGGLKVREHPKTGFYVESLTSSPVTSYKEIEAKIDEGTKNRTIAATSMNATSSRAHTIVKIQFNQKTGKGGTTKQSQVNLVDLAGSERQQDAQTEGDRLKEGIVINQSLSTLGRVIKALHDQQKAKKKVQIPYRDSVLTCLLKNALGGNSKTIMIAALSPADINYEETLSTLRFADRAKSIKTQAVVNESATERMIRELREENAKLQAGIKGGGGNSEEIENLRRQLAENQKEMANLEKTWQQKVAEEAAKAGNVSAERAAILEKKKTVSHLWNLNEDPALTNVIVHFIPEGELTVGNSSANPPAAIQLNGLSIQPQHAIIVNKGNKKFTLKELEGADILLNGKRIQGETELSQNDRIHFGGNHLYVFCNPQKGAANQDITWDMAQKEIASNAGLASGGSRSGMSKAELMLEEELIALFPAVYRANAMAKELKKKVNFETVLVSPEARGLEDGLTEIWIRVHNTADDTHFLWEKTRFMSRYYGMQEMYENKMDGEDWELPKERDPFYEPPDSEVFIGGAVVYLQSLSYLVDSEETYSIVDFDGKEMGHITVSLAPCSSSGKEINGAYVENPSTLVGKSIGFKVKLLSASGLPKRLYGSSCKYRFFNEKEAITPNIPGTDPSYNHENFYAYRNVSKELIDYLAHNSLYIRVWGTQKAGTTRRSSMSLPMPPRNGETRRSKTKGSTKKKSGSTKSRSNSGSKKRKGSKEPKSAPK
ncbi:unnamed protein product, partial [Mesorhabditis spiculigera]